MSTTKTLTTVFLFILLSSGDGLFGSSTKVTPGRDSDVGLNAMKLAGKYGYPFQEHTVRTEDGYVLALHRVQGGKSNKATDKGAVLLVPGILSSSVDWLNMGPGRSLGFILSDSGYDVWILNPRGTALSKKHASLNPKVDKDKYWNFSWHEIGYYDLPATIDYILKTTGEKKLHYIGHSMGTTAFFAMASTKTEYNKKIKLMSALAPLAFMTEKKNHFFRLLAKPSNYIGGFSKAIGQNEFNPNSTIFPSLGSADCEEEAWLPDICSSVIFLICGYDSQQLEPSKIPVIESNSPAGGSSKEFLHYSQIIKSKGQFRQYDYGEIENMKVYGSAEPPTYDISKITAPVALYYSENDQLATVKDVEVLRKALYRLVMFRRVPFASFNHLDFVYAKNVVKYVYNDVLDKMQDY